MDKLYYTIGEVADMLGVNPSALRYYEERFPELRPAKNSRGVRRYTAADIELLRRIVDLSRQGSYTLSGVRSQLHPDADGHSLQELQAAVQTLRQVRSELTAISGMLSDMES